MCGATSAKYGAGTNNGVGLWVFVALNSLAGGGLKPLSTWGSGRITFLWVCTQMGEAGHWALKVRHRSKVTTLEGAMVIHHLTINNPYGLPPGWLSWIPPRNLTTSGLLSIGRGVTLVGGG